MNFLLAWKLALRYLGLNAGTAVSNARKSLIGAIWGIGISIIPLVIVLVVSDGMIKGITSRMIELGSGHIQILDLRPTPRSAQTAADRKQSTQTVFDSIRDNAQSVITGSRRQQEGTGLLIGKIGRSGGTIRAIEAGYFTENLPARNLLTVVDGSLEFDGARSILLGKRLRRKPVLKSGIAARCLRCCRNIRAIRRSLSLPVLRWQALSLPAIRSLMHCGFLSR